MAITLVQTPANVCKAGQDIMYVASSDNVLEVGFKYFVEVYEGATLIYEAYISPNISDFMMFNLRQVALSRLHADVTAEGSETPHGRVLIGNYAFKKGQHINKIWQVRVGEVYEVSGVLTEDDNLANHDIHIFDGWNRPSDGYGKLLSASDFGLGNKGWATDRTTATKTSPSEISVTGTYGELYVNAAETDWGTTGFYNNKNTSPGINTFCDKINYQIFNAAGSSLGAVDITLNGASYSGLPTSTNAYDKVVYMDTYPANISYAAHAVRQNSISPADLSTWAYYVFTPLTSADVQVGSKLVFYKEEALCKHKRWTLGWQGSFGAYEYLPFTGRVEYELRRKSKKYNTLMGNYATTTFTYSGAERQEQEYNPQADKYIRISNYFTEGEFILLQSAMVSKEVVLIESLIDGAASPNVIPVILETNSLKVHEELESKMKDVELTVKIAQTYAFS